MSTATLNPPRKSRALTISMEEIVDEVPAAGNVTFGEMEKAEEAVEAGTATPRQRRIIKEHRESDFAKDFAISMEAMVKKIEAATAGFLTPRHRVAHLVGCSLDELDAALDASAVWSLTGTEPTDRQIEIEHRFTALEDAAGGCEVAGLAEDEEDLARRLSPVLKILENESRLRVMASHPSLVQAISAPSARASRHLAKGASGRKPRATASRPRAPRRRITNKGGDSGDGAGGDGSGGAGPHHVCTTCGQPLPTGYKGKTHSREDDLDCRRRYENQRQRWCRAGKRDQEADAVELGLLSEAGLAKKLTEARNLRSNTASSGKMRDAEAAEKVHIEEISELWAARRRAMLFCAHQCPLRVAQIARASEEFNRLADDDRPSIEPDYRGRTASFVGTHPKPRASKPWKRTGKRAPRKVAAGRMAVAA